MRHIKQPQTRSPQNRQKTETAPQPDLNLDQEGHAKTHALLTALIVKLEQTSSDQSGRNQPTVYQRFLQSPFSTLAGFVSNLGGAWTVLLTATLMLPRFIPVFPRFANSLSSILIPFGIFTATAVTVAATGRWIKRRPLRIRFLAWMMGGYGLMTMVYLIWLSLGFLHHNTLPSGFLLATCWYGAISIYRKTVPDVKEMLALGEKNTQ